MRGPTILSLLLILAITFPAIARAQPGTAAPPGSYERSCTFIAYDAATQILSAYCAWQPNDLLDGTNSSLWVPGCEAGTDIENNRGWLQCKARTGSWGYAGAVPDGSYQKSCWDWYVTSGPTLTARCHSFNGKSTDIGSGISDDDVNAQLPNLAQCNMHGDIQNIRGQLVCAPAGANSGPPAPAAPLATLGLGLQAPGGCKPGYVWRQADARDHVCVTTQTRQQVSDDDAAARQHGNLPNLITHKPGVCLQGYVWRDAYATDYVCVIPNTRDQAARDNAAAASRTN
jgi:hypothetical protein